MLKFVKTADEEPEPQGWRCNPDLPAYPVEPGAGADDPYNGLTKREYFAAKALAGISARGGSPAECAEWAGAAAAALVQVLNYGSVIKRGHEMTLSEELRKEHAELYPAPPSHEAAERKLQQEHDLNERKARLGGMLLGAAEVLDRVEGELGQIDAALGNRAAFDGCANRLEKILLAIKIASANDPKGELAKLHHELDQANKLIQVLRDENNGMATRIAMLTETSTDAAEERSDTGSIPAVGEVAEDR